MAQTVPFDALLGASKTGLAIGATIYELDGSTSYAAFSTTGWYEAPSGSGGWHHAGLSLPDAGGVVAVGIAATEYLRIAVDAAPATAPTVGDIDTQLSNTHGAGDWITATGFATPTNVSDAQTAITNAITALNNLSNTDLTNVQDVITAAIAALNNLSSAQAQSAATAALNSYDPPTKTELDTAQTTIIDAVPTAVETADVVLARGMAHIDLTAEENSIYELIQAIFQSSTVTGEWVIKKTNGVTTFNTRTLTTDPNALPIIGVA